ncbi:threonine/serine ThrE exporter family protein [Jonesia quinghaiensis]|uniref:threonine/serine ThrE exporter family protein n=1 Tax=Jonesia quinghaiensis TaxID=262806 RepID=UPI0004012BB4|nr:threonine/serine exporter family protein [Jonesia quinghaiensis]
MDGAYVDESRFEPVELIRASRTVVRVGLMLLTVGSGSYRVKNSMSQMGAALGMSSVQAQVTVNEITATCHRGEIYRTEIAQTRAIGVNSQRIKQLQNYCESLTPLGEHADSHVLNERLKEVEQHLDAIERQPPLYPAFANALFAGVACAAFAFLNNGGPVEISAVFVAASLGQLARRAFLHRGFNQLAVTMVAAAVASGVYLAISNALFATGAVETLHDSGYVSAVLFLVPGFPLMSASLDLSRLDFSAGMSRLAYALLIMISAALSVWAVSATFGLEPTPTEPVALSAWALLAFRMLASAGGVWGFAMIFNSPWHIALWAAFIGMIANVLRLELIGVGFVPQGAAFFAGLTVGVLANMIAPRIRVPRLTLSVPAVVIMVPGAAGYRAIHYLNSGDTLQALAYGVEAVFIVIAIAIGLTMARSVTDLNWLRLGREQH